MVQRVNLGSWWREIAFARWTTCLALSAFVVAVLLAGCETLAAPDQVSFSEIDGPGASATEIENSAQRPRLKSEDGPWGALSGLAGDPSDSNVLFAVPDKTFPNQVYRIELSLDEGSLIGSVTREITIKGQRNNLDPEGVAIDTSIAASDCPGFWIASEGNAKFDLENYRQNLLAQVDCTGQVLQEIALPTTVDSPHGGLVSRQGFEGVAVSSDGEFLLALIKTRYPTDGEGSGGMLYTRIARFSLETRQWDFFLYPLKPEDPDIIDVGLSSILNAGADCYLVMERDKLFEGEKKVKRVYGFKLDGVQPVDEKFLVRVDADLSPKTLSKTLLVGVEGDYLPTEIAEGLALAADGALWAAVDTDSQSVQHAIIRHGNLSDIAGGSPCS